MELRRRVILLICVWSACWLAYYAPLRPVVAVEPVEPEKYEQAINEDVRKNASERSETESAPDEAVAHGKADKGKVGKADDGVSGKANEGRTGKADERLTGGTDENSTGPNDEIQPDEVRLEKSLNKPLLDKPRDFSFGAITRGKLIHLTGRQWEDFYLNTVREGSGTRRPAEWDGRVSSSGYYNSSYLFFYPREAPVNSIMEHLKKDNDDIYAAVEVEGKPRYLHFSYKVYTEDDDFHWGAGFSAYPNPPTRMIYPARRFGLWLGGAALLIHFLMPGRRKIQGAVTYARWRVAMGDVFALILAVPFFVLPMMVIGGAVQAVTLAWPLSAVMWPMAFSGGAVLLTYSTWYASYEVALCKDGLMISSYKGSKEYKFSDISYHQRAEIRAPRWFIRFMRIASIFSGRLLASSAMVSSSAYKGIALGLRNKGIVYVWITDQMGSAALSGYGAIQHALKQGGIPEVDGERLVESMGLVTEELPDGQRQRDWAAAVVYSLLIVPVAVAVIGFIYVMFFYRY
jgi:hypothetical protein